MMVKTHKKVTGIPSARAVVTGGEAEMGAATVVLRISAVDEFDMAEVVATLRLSPEEARDVGRRLIAAAEVVR